MRRLPIYLVIDCSESMVGKPIKCVEEGIATIIRTLKQSPYALETTVLSVIAFAGKSIKLISMEEIYRLTTVKLPIGGGTSLGNAFRMLMDDIDKCVKKNTYEEKGDWRPIVFVFTDGNPTDRTEDVARIWREKYGESVLCVAVSIGNNLDTKILKQFTDNVYMLENTDPKSFEQFFDWITQSINSSSRSVSRKRHDGSSLSVTNSVVKKVDQPDGVIVDDNYIVILSRCQTTRNYYLIKYQKSLTNPTAFELEGAYPVDDNYFALSADGYENLRVNTDHLFGHPTCPICGNESAIGICSCGGVLCVRNNQINVCPHCGKKSYFGSSDVGVDINRTIG